MNRFQSLFQKENLSYLKEKTNFILPLLGLVIINFFFFVLQLATNSFSNNSWMIKDGALWEPSIEQGELYRFWTSTLLHANFEHLFGNMTALIILGFFLGMAIGGLRLVLIYLTSAASAAWFVMLFQSALTIGASGAIFGLAGASIIIGIRQRKYIMLLVSFFWLLSSLWFTFAIPGISIAGHLGGLIGGMIIGWFFTQERQNINEFKAILLACLFTFLFSMLALYMA